MDGGAWKTVVHVVAKSRTRLSMHTCTHLMESLTLNQSIYFLLCHHPLSAIVVMIVIERRCPIPFKSKIEILRSPPVLQNWHGGTGKQ